MKKIVSVFILAGVVMLGSAFSPVTLRVMAEEKAAVKTVDVGNKICPVMGSEATPTITVEYKGKIYHLCCPMCVQTFNQNPEKYSKIADDEVAAQEGK